MAEGNTWIYGADLVTQTKGQPQAESSGEIEFKLANVKKLGDKTQATLQVYQGDNMIDQSTWEESSDGIRQLTSGIHNTPYDKPEPVMNLPLKKSETISWSNTGSMPNGKPGSQTGKTVVTLAPQVDTDVDSVVGVSSVASSRFQCGASTGTADTTTFFSANVGIVRLIQVVKEGNTTNKMTLRLKSSKLAHS